MTTDTMAERLGERIALSGTDDELRRVLAEVAELPPDHPAIDPILAIEEDGFERLRRATATRPDLAAAILQHDVLPRCLPTGPSRSRLRELFGAWLEQLPFDRLKRVRAVALATALKRLEPADAGGGFALIARVEYADPDVCRHLETLFSEHADEFGDRALAVRVSLGTSPKARTLARKSLHARLRKRLDRRLLGVAAKVGDRETIGAVLDAWLRSDPSEEPAAFNTLTVLSVLAPIAADRAAAAELWHRLASLDDADRRESIAEAMNLGVIVQFDTPEVVRHLLARLPDRDGPPKWRGYIRLEECRSPAQLGGWDGVESELLDAVRNDAVRDLTHGGQFETAEFREKQSAWRVLLCAGKPEALPSIGEAIQTSAGGYFKQELLELASCLPGGLPAGVPEILAGSADQFGWEADEFIVTQIGAVRAAHGAMTAEAFEALVDYRPQRGILVAVVDALADIAVGAEPGSRRLVDRLFDLAETSPNPTARATSAAALAELLGGGRLTNEEARRLAGRVAARGTELYTLRSLLYAFAKRLDAPTTHEMLAAVERLASPGGATREERDAGLPEAALFLTGSRLRDEDDSAFADRFGLIVSGGRVRVRPGAAPPPAALRLLAQRYPLDPVRYAPAVSELIRAGSYQRLAILLPPVRKARLDNPSEVIAALVDRAHRMDRGREAEPVLLELLAEVAPDRLLGDDWRDLDRWAPPARAAMADALGRVGPLPDDLAEARVRLLVRLAGDGLYGVRRAAYRAYAAADPLDLAALLGSWAAATGNGPGLRARAAEGSAWLAEADATGKLARLEYDPEPVVRHAQKRASGDRRQLEWRESYENFVLAAETPHDVVRLWRYASALGGLGDDRTVEVLHRRASARPHPAVRFWLARIRKAAERR